MAENGTRLEYARTKIGADSYVACICGQMFHEAQEYADHVATCEHSQREIAARGEWERA